LLHPLAHNDQTRPVIAKSFAGVSASVNEQEKVSRKGILLEYLPDFLK
jgi:hypothetical protein